MSEILIKGMDLLPEGCAYDVRIRGNGDVVDRVTGRVMGHAIELPTHGRLGDITQFVEDIINSETLKNEFTPYQLTLLRQLAKNAPTIIEASTNCIKERE